jgi:Xaa-Pro dipeptidase
MQDPDYALHLQTLNTRWTHALEAAGFESVIVAAGAPRNYFLDDQSPPFRGNPHFTQWLPGQDSPHSALLIRPGERPRLYFFQPADYWHQPPETPTWNGDAFEILLFDDLAQLDQALRAAAATSNRTAFVGEDPPPHLVGATGNPPRLLSELHYVRARKTAFEVACMARATERAVRGHVAARSAFEEGASEFAIHLRYLIAAGQTSEDLPYPSIVAQNAHAGVLHYQHYDRQPPACRRSFLIDAGATFRGYAADITRTYTATGAPDGDRFDALVQALDAAQQTLIRSIRPGADYVTLHESAHRAIADILVDQGLLRCTAEQAFETGLTRTFLPHGLGHLIGLQTHDVGGLQAAPDGTPRPPPAAYPALRLTRPVEVDQVFTIEPGLYFIPQLLTEAADSGQRRLIDWDLVQRLAPFGGIRIEDNVVVTGTGVRNLTREAFGRDV